MPAKMSRRVQTHFRTGHLRAAGKEEMNGTVQVSSRRSMCMTMWRRNNSTMCSYTYIVMQVEHNHDVKALGRPSPLSNTVMPLQVAGATVKG